MKKDVSFEQAMEKLEVLVEKLSTGNLTLDETIKTYQEGMSLSEFCQSKLSDAEGRVLKITNKDNGETEEFKAAD